jgi:hypothetical protein
MGNMRKKLFNWVQLHFLKKNSIDFEYSAYLVLDLALGASYGIKMAVCHSQTSCGEKVFWDTHLDNDQFV